MKKIKIDEIAGLLNLSEGAADVYLALLVHGDLSREDLKGLLSENNKIDEGLKELADKEMVFKLVGEKNEETYEVLTPLQLEERIDRQKKVIDNLKAFVIPRVQPVPKLAIVKYEGLEGIRKVYLEILEEAVRTGEEILAFESEKQGLLLGEEFLDSYIQKRMEAGVKAYVLAPDTPEDRIYQQKVEGNLTFVRLLKKFDIDANINVVGDLVMSFSVNPAHGVMRRNRAEADTLKAIFRRLWDS